MKNTKLNLEAVRAKFGAEVVDRWYDIEIKSGWTAAELDNSKFEESVWAYILEPFM